MNADRHKTPREYSSGSQKRKKVKVQQEKVMAVVTSSRRMTEFVTVGCANVAGTSGQSGCKESEEIEQELETTEATEQTEQLIVCYTDTAPSDEALGLGLSKVNNTDNMSISSTDEFNVQTAVESLPVTDSKIMSNSNDSDCEIDNKMPARITDVALWPDHPTTDFKDYWVHTGFHDIQHCDEKLFETQSVMKQAASNLPVRRCTLQMFNRCTKNGEVHHRSWRCFSPSTGKVYCYVCKLFSKVSSQLTQDGFDDWYHASVRFAEHERSSNHAEAALIIFRRAAELGRIERQLAEQMSTVTAYWRNTLKRVVSVIKFICVRGLAIRGHTEKFGSPHNGNFLGILELLSEYDEFLAEHIAKYSDKGSGHVSYLSSTVCEELVMIMAKQVLNEIIQRIKASKYYSISLDSTPDESHVEQLTLVFRYLENSSPVERFVTFVDNRGHKAVDMFKALEDFLEAHQIDIADCRGQSYDNASSMSGKYNGLRALVMKANPAAIWVPCTGHSLNLVGKTAAECCSAAISFFDLLQQVYTFFSGSTHRYQVLREKLKNSEPPLWIPKKLSETRWSCRYDATRAFYAGYHLIKEALVVIGDDDDEKAIVRSQVDGMYEHV
jgi:Domain of unknown function (DUF4371)